MNNTDNEWFLRVLAILGFVVTVCLLAWLAVQIVRFIPTVFSSLASVFESNQRELRDRTDNGNVVVVREGEEGVYEDEDEEEVEETTEEEVEVVATSTPSTPAPRPTPPPVQYKTVTTYKVPVSNPNGVTDLQVAFVAVGRMTGEGRFVPTTSLREGESSALQFTVKNIGTKTSGDWHFSAELPGGGTMNSKVQLPLKPSETTTLTVAFTPESRGNRTAAVTAIGGNDINLANNGFRVNVEVVR